MSTLTQEHDVTTQTLISSKTSLKFLANLLLCDSNYKHIKLEAVDITPFFIFALFEF